MIVWYVTLLAPNMREMYCYIDIVINTHAYEIPFYRRINSPLFVE